jgi:PAS domain-containing protein
METRTEEQEAIYTDLRRSEIRYRRLFEAARDGILILDIETRKITDANPFMVELLGYSRDVNLRPYGAISVAA